LDRRVVLSVLIYIVAACADNLLTYYCVVIGDYYEANPFAAVMVYSQPLWVWFLSDFLVIAAVVGVSYLYYTVFRRYSVVARYWLIIFAVAIARLLPVIHNIVLLLTGYETPLPVAVQYIARCLGQI